MPIKNFHISLPPLNLIFNHFDKYSLLFNLKLNTMKHFKKLLYLLITLTFFISCEKENLIEDEIIKEKETQVSPKSQKLDIPKQSDLNS